MKAINRVLGSGGGAELIWVRLVGVGGAHTLRLLSLCWRATWKKEKKNIVRTRQLAARALLELTETKVIVVEDRTAVAGSGGGGPTTVEAS